MSLPATSGDPRPSGPSDLRRRRLLFRATHRGLQETDRLLGGFVAGSIDRLTQAELDSLEEIMELPDIDLADWLMGRRPVPPELRSPLLDRILEDARGTPAPRPAP